MIYLFLLSLFLFSSSIGYSQTPPTCPTVNTTPSFQQGGTVFGRTGPQWNQYLGSKADANNGILCNPTFGPNANFYTPNIIGNANFANSGTGTNASSPVNPGDLTNKQYVDSKAVGLTPQLAVKWETGGNPLSNSPTYSNGNAGVGATLKSTTSGALVINGNATSLNDRILVKDEPNQTWNGVYSQTQVGSPSQPYILTRVTDWDTATQMLPNSYFFASSDGTGWTFVNPNTVVVVG